MKSLFKSVGHIVFNSKIWAYGLFWSWNIIFLAFMILGFAPQTMPDMIAAVRAGQIPVAFLFYAMVITLIPAVAVGLGLTRLRNAPGRLFALGYGVEGPLMLLLAIRFFAVRQVTPALGLLLTVAVLGMVTFLWQLLDFNIDARGTLLTHLRAVGLSLTLITGVYAGIWVGFYALPLGITILDFIINEILFSIPYILKEFWEALITLNWQDVLLMGVTFIPFMILGTVLLAYTATLFAVMPVAVLILYTKAWWRGMQTLANRYSPARGLVINAVMLTICLVLFRQTNQQPQHQAFALLEQPPTTPAEAQALLEKKDIIRAGLLNAYLAPHRYFSAKGEVRHVKEMYEWTFNMPAEYAAKIQQFYDAVAGPVLYQPVNPPQAENDWDNQVLRQEPAEAAELYETFFDQTIINGERDTIIRAVQSTWNVDQAVTARRAVDDREIYLVSQHVSVTEHGDWAEVELYEVYQNHTAQREEVIYYFSLPESAVVTGVWLGNSANRDERFAYRVSPRGAAQAMYRNEVRRRVDPALVEQIGPRQYRLRIFPVEPQRLSWQNTRSPILQEGPPLHMWLTWRAMARDNTWPLPHLAELRNVYWDDDTTRQVNGQPMQVDSDTWLPAGLPATSATESVTHRVDFWGGQSVIAQPVSTEDLPELDPQLRLAVVLDRSHSMTPLTDKVAATLTQLKESIGENADVFLTASSYRGEEPVRVALHDPAIDNIMYFGGQNAAELLIQFDTLHQNEVYDAILVLTDGTGYELGENEIEVPTFNASVWMVHLDGNFPLGYDDATLEAIQSSGGGIAGSLAEALTRLAVTRNDTTSAPTNGSITNDDIIRDVVDGYIWSTIPTEDAQAQFGSQLVSHAPNDNFTAIAARRIILAEMQRHRGQLSQLDTLDYLHEIAVGNSVVTPYSSMIVLINDWQEKRLDELEEQADRFQREHEDVGDTAPENPFTVTGVPEPEEWLLLALVGAMLMWYLYKKRNRAGSFGFSKR